MGKYFCNFYRGLFPYLTAYNVNVFYGHVFSWYLGDSGNVDYDLDESLLARWVRNERELPRRILIQAMNDPNTAAEQYDVTFQKLDDELGTKATEMYDMLSSSLTTLRKALPIDVTFEYDYSGMAKVFTISLVCDGILSDERLIEAGLRNAVKKRMEKCKKDDHIFSTMYILEILLNSPNRLLGHMLEKCSADDVSEETGNLKTKWEQKTAAYSAKEYHKQFLPTELNDIELFQHAKLLAYSARSKPGVAGELEICKALVRCSDEASTSIRSLKADLGEMTDTRKWDALANECYEQMCRTSI